MKISRKRLTILVFLVTVAAIGATARAHKPVTAPKPAVQPIKGPRQLHPLRRLKWIVRSAIHRPSVATGVVAGRFQILHKDHMKYILAAKRRCGHLVVGITNPDPSLTKADAADPKRHLPENNPLSFFERKVMVESALGEAGLKLGKDFSVVPLPINFPKLYNNYLPRGATFFATDYDGWGERKLQQFHEQGFSTHMLWKRPKSQKGISATEVRNRMVAGKAWEQMVPSSVAHHLKAWQIPGRLQRIAAEKGASK
jgi:nicotinamide-nucleotide adenylyltransferase